jgi:ribosomal protein S1
MSSRSIGTPAEMVNVGDELTLLVIRVDPNERRIGLSLKELAHAIMPAPEIDTSGGAQRRGKKSKGRRDDYEYDDDN